MIDRLVVAACLALAAYALLGGAGSNANYLLAGGLLYFLGSVVVTIVCNVPLNNAIARADPASADGARVWQHFLSAWTRWNHVRTVTALAAAATLTLALLN